MQRKVKPMTIILIGALIVVLGGIVGAFGTFMHNKASSRKSTATLAGVTKTGEDVAALKEQNIDLKKQSDTLRERLEKQSTTIDDLRKENTDLHLKLADKALDIYNYISGGDSYCAVGVVFGNAAKDATNLIFHVYGKYPLNDVKARIVDLNNFNASTTIDGMFQNTLSIGTLQPGSAVTTYEISLNKINGVRLNIFIDANNGHFVQSLRMRFINGKWVSAKQVINPNNGKVLYKTIDTDYPEKDESKLFF